MSDRQFFDFVQRKEFQEALTFLQSCSDAEGHQHLTKQIKYGEGFGDSWNALTRASHLGDAPEELIRAMVKRGPKGYINIKDSWGRTAAAIAAWLGDSKRLDLLLTISADPDGCRKWANVDNIEACLTVLDRFDQRTTLACCVRQYDELHQTSPLVHHPDITALETFARILHDLHGINGDMHSISLKIITYV
jgi:hypothetical protein